MDRNDFLKLFRSGEDFVVKKGSEQFRSTTAENEILVGKKYVSLRSSDVGTYHMFVQDMFPDKKVYDITYQNKRNLNVAGTKTEAKLLQEMYGKELRSDSTFKKYVEKGWIDLNKITKPIDEMTDDEFYSYLYYNPYGHDYDILNKSIVNPDTNRYIKTMIDRGYDAVVDMTDVSIGYADGPVIVLDTQKTLSKKNAKIY